MAIMGRVGFGYVVTAELFMSLFSSDPEVIAAALVLARPVCAWGLAACLRVCIRIPESKPPHHLVIKRFHLRLPT